MFRRGKLVRKAENKISSGPYRIRANAYHRKPQWAACLFQLAFRRNSQFLTTLCATAGQDFTTIGCLHALTETVNGFTTTTVWLKCSFHFSMFLQLKNSLPVESQSADFQSHRATIPACVVKGTAKVIKYWNKKELNLSVPTSGNPKTRNYSNTDTWE